MAKSTPRKIRINLDAKFNFLNYENLSGDELLAISNYYYGSTYWFDELLIAHNKPLSKDAARFIADALAGRIEPRKTGESVRDYDIYFLVKLHLCTGMRLTDNQKGLGAIAKVAGKLNLSESVVKRAYSTVKKDIVIAEKLYPEVGFFCAYWAFKGLRT
ncbi:MAG: hypothetical protein QX189_15845 [Methylococcales bacterium]